MDTGGTIHTRDTIASRLVWNYYNRKPMTLYSYISNLHIQLKHGEIMLIILCKRN